MLPTGGVTCILGRYDFPICLLAASQTDGGRHRLLEEKTTPRAAVYRTFLPVGGARGAYHQVCLKVIASDSLRWCADVCRTRKSILRFISRTSRFAISAVKP